jgi:UDP-N-acetylmuramoylalanine--D-glutamate ligase
LKGRRIAVFGLGRSGLAIGKAARALGGIPTIFDEKREQDIAKQDILEEAREAGLDVRLGQSPLSSESDRFDLMVTNPAVDMRHQVLQEALQRGIEVVSEVEFAYRISKAPIVAVTGTNGKSTTVVMTYLCLREAGIDAVLCGNIFGSGYPEMPMTEAALASKEGQILVAEISSFQLEWVQEFRPVSAGITNVAPDHQDRYDSFEQYAKTKRRIFAAQTSSDFAVYRPDAPLTEPGSGEAQRLTFGPKGEHVRVADGCLKLFERSIPLETLPLLEGHNLLNASMAALLSYGGLISLGFEPKPALDAIESGLRKFQGIEHRMQNVGACGGIRLVNNSMCTNPEAVVASVQSLHQPAHILIGGLNKGLDFEPVARFVAEQGHSAYLYGASAEEIAADFASVAGRERFVVCTTMQEAFARAIHNAKTGETVILAPGCASMDQFRDFRDRGSVFTSLAKEWLQTCSEP